MNEMLNSMENNEQKNQISVKERERQIQEDKSKLNRKVDKLTKTIENLEQEVSEKNISLEIFAEK